VPGGIGGSDCHRAAQFHSQSGPLGLEVGVAVAGVNSLPVAPRT
jgi:hypothetical protein